MSREPAREYGNGRIGVGAAALALLASFLWGGTQPFIKLGLDGLPPLMMAAARFGVGWLIMAGAVRWRRVPLALNPGELRGLAGLTCLFFVQIYLLNKGTAHTSAIRSSILIATHPFWIAGLCHFLVPGDRLSLRKAVGMALAFSGVLLIFADSIGSAGDLARSSSTMLSVWQQEHIVGDALILGSAAFLGARIVVMKRLVRGLDPLKLLFWQFLLAVPLFAAASAIVESDAPIQLTPQVVGAVLYQGVVVAGFCFIVWIHLLQRYSASRLGAFSFTTPVLGVTLSVLLVGDTLAIEHLASVVLVAAGILIVERA